MVKSLEEGLAEAGLSATELDRLLVETSRTFALAIPLLGEPIRRAVGVAYLLFRVADTLEDAEAWPVARRAQALQQLAELLQTKQDSAAVSHSWLSPAPLQHEGYLRLLALTPELLAATDALEVSQILRDHTIRTAHGMREVQLTFGAEGGELALKSKEDLRQYCYYVAGIVGELLTDIFVHYAPSLQAELPALRREERWFGEGLQLVNILKDERDDAAEDRVFIPKGVSRAELLTLAREDLEAAERYAQAIERGGAPAGVRAFVRLPLAMAKETLEVLERHGPGAKISRERALQLFSEHQALAAS